MQNLKTTYSKETMKLINDFKLVLAERVEYLKNKDALYSQQIDYLIKCDRICVEIKRVIAKVYANAIPESLELIEEKSNIIRINKNEKAN